MTEPIVKVKTVKKLKIKIKKGDKMNNNTDNKCLNKKCSNYITATKCKMFKLIEWCGYHKLK
jgi:hypothetical protein